MKLKSGHQAIRALKRIGISHDHALSICGQECEPTGRKGKQYVQVKLSKEILNMKHAFVFCVPNSVIE